MKKHTLFFLALFALLHACNCDEPIVDGGDDSGVGNDASHNDASNEDPDPQDCASLSEICGEGSTCCGSLICDETSGRCAESGRGSCLAEGDPCSDAADCCDSLCDSAGRCASCSQNGESCEAHSDCCTGVCAEGGTCAPAAQTGCTSYGNTCTSDASCCSKSCVSGRCAQTGGHCVALNDTCFSDEECCSQRCSADGSGEGGVCLTLNVEGIGSCKMAGEPCVGCTDCCSQTCVPSVTGVLLCLRASGCVLEGELCEETADCCGSEPSEAGTQICKKLSPDDRYGRCVLTGNTPDGAVCKSETPWCTSSNAPSNCGNCEGPKSQCCRLDANGTPRCFGGSTPDCPAGYDSNNPECCVAAGEVCNFASECCGSTPCLPDNEGVLRCGATCAAEGATCTTTSDCCTGFECASSAPGEPPTCTQPGEDPPICSQFGQSCDSAQPCCTFLTCRSPATGGGCDEDEEGCTCFGILAPG